MKSADPQQLAEHLRKGAKFDILKGREGYFRPYDNQMVQEMYAVRAKEPGKMKDQFDIYEPLGSCRARARTWRCCAPEGRRLQDRVSAHLSRPAGRGFGGGVVQPQRTAV
jgi:hypothetical protein